MLALMAAAPLGRQAAAKQMQSLHLPAEEAPHARTWMCWPSTKSIYGSSTAYFESIQETTGRLAAAIAEHEPVTMLAGAAFHRRVAELCGPKVRLADIATDDMWARDTGPVFMRRQGALAAVDFNFNGWGEKQDHARDGRVAAAIAELAGCTPVRAAVVGEGGGLEYDGDGTLILTESCWLDDNRNPGLSRDAIEAELKARLGLEAVIWLPGVRGRDITDGHIDGMLRIVRPGLLLLGGYPGDTSGFGRAQAEARAILRRAKDARGRTFQIVEIEDAVEPRSSHPDLFTGYTNYYVGNGAIYTPEFGDRAADARAQETLARLFPGRRVVALEVDRIYENGGGIHCVTQQQPA